MQCKTCFKCSSTLPFSEFYKHKMMADGHLNGCKDCTKQRISDHRRRNIEKIREYDRERSNQPHRVQARKEYQQTEAYKKVLSKARDVYKIRYPIRKAANSAVGKAVRDGRLIRLPCEICGANETEGHHASYSLPLHVTWLCDSHHKLLHKQFREMLRNNAE